MQGCASPPASKCPGPVPCLPHDIGELVRDKLSMRELAEVAGTSRAWWHRAGRRAEAVDLEAAPRSHTDVQLTRPTPALHVIQRLLHHRHPCTGEPVSLPGPQAISCTRFHRSGPFFNEVYILWYHRWPARMLLGLVQPSFSMDRPHVDGLTIYRNGFQASVRYVCVRLNSIGPDGCAWMQGLLVAFTGGFQGLLWVGRFSNIAEQSCSGCKTPNIFDVNHYKKGGKRGNLARHCIPYWLHSRSEIFIPAGIY